MKHVTSAMIVALGLFASLVPVSAHAGDNAPKQWAGYDRFDVSAAHRSRPLAASIWYPAGTHIYRAPVGKSAIWQSVDAYIGAAIAPGKYPLVLLSHGSGGNMDGIGWLSSALALRGAIVLAVNHPGTTSGDSSPRRTVQLGVRAMDITATLDQVLSNPEFAPYIDTDRISAVGFSLGGTTVLNLAGVQFDRDAYGDYCAEFQDNAQDCAFLAKGGVRLDHLPDDFETTHSDPRISSIVAIEPGMTDAVKSESLDGIDEDILFIRLGREHGWRAADVGPNGSNILARLGNAQLAVFSPANHLTFLAECVPGAAELLAQMDDDPICSDPEGTDRGKIHQDIIDEIVRFLSLAG
ncbi:alpha/beta hydrolase family protein [Thalassospira australica]|uniref:alpha/beta hydrolase family protein n=1 Tax=Thalassospira australica TaxID=1528106 RepID=UPI00051A4EF5|nr:hypothetical protein [Thalassospira australica]